MASFSEESFILRLASLNCLLYSNLVKLKVTLQNFSSSALLSLSLGRSSLILTRVSTSGVCPEPHLVTVCNDVIPVDVIPFKK